MSSDKEDSTTKPHPVWAGGPGGPFPRTVTCAWCGNHYRSACPGGFDHGTQGSHCASSAIFREGRWIVVGGYGSDEHDLHAYEFVSDPPGQTADPVCDECVSQRLSAGQLRQISPEHCAHGGDFSPRPHGTYGLVSQISRMMEREVAMRALCDAAMKASDAGHPGLSEVVHEYRKFQRWNGEIEDDGEEYAEGAPEVASQIREAARHLEDLAVFWEKKAR